MTTRAAFLEARRRFIGGSDIGAIVGLSTYATPLTVYLDKVGESQPQAETLAMRRGKVMEPFIAREFHRQHPGLVVIRRQEQVVRTDWGFPAGASLDGFVAAQGDKSKTPVGAFESKTAYGWTARDWDAKTEDVPDSYFCQGVWNLAVSGMEEIYVVADIGDPEKLIVVVFRATPEVKRVQLSLIKHARDFWRNHVERLIPPEPNGSERDSDAIRGMFRRTIPVTVELEGASTVVERYNRGHEMETKGKEVKARAKQELELLLGSGEQAIVDGRWRYSWKPSTKRSVDMDRLMVEYPEAWKAVMKETTTRRFGAPKEVGE
jgi:putative phage-type endonuclease